MASAEPDDRVAPVAPAVRFRHANGADLDRRVHSAHRRAELEVALVTRRTRPRAVHVFRSVAGPGVLPSPAGARRATGGGFRAIDLIAHFPRRDRQRLGIAVLCAQRSPVAHALPVAPPDVHADPRRVADAAIEERHRRCRFLRGAIHRHRPDGRIAGGPCEVQHVRRSRGPCPVTASAVTHLAGQPVVGIAPAAAGETQHGRSEGARQRTHRIVGEIGRVDPRRHVGAEQARVERAPHVGGADRDHRSGRGW